MKASIKKKWLEALRSGKYQQGRGQLKCMGERYCCLGVLTDLYLKEKPKKRAWFGELKGADKDVDTVIGPSMAYTPLEVMQWAGLPDQNPVVKFKGKNTSLADLNDGSGGIGEPRSFLRIAQVIEKQL